MKEKCCHISVTGEADGCSGTGRPQSRRAQDAPSPSGHMTPPVPTGHRTAPAPTGEPPTQDVSAEAETLTRLETRTSGCT